MTDVTRARRRIWISASKVDIATPNPTARGSDLPIVEYKGKYKEPDADEKLIDLRDRSQNP